MSWLMSWFELDKLLASWAWALKLGLFIIDPSHELSLSYAKFRLGSGRLGSLPVLIGISVKYGERITLLHTASLMHVVLHVPVELWKCWHLRMLNYLNKKRKWYKLFYFIFSNTFITPISSIVQILPSFSGNKNIWDLITYITFTSQHQEVIPDRKIKQKIIRLFMIDMQLLPMFFDPYFTRLGRDGWAQNISPRQWLHLLHHKNVFLRPFFFLNIFLQFY